MSSMASWKVNGVVPDSDDDDEESLNGQNVALSSSDILDGIGTGRKVPNRNVEKNHAGKGTPEKSSVRNRQATQQEANITEGSKPNVDNLRILPASSPALQPVFQIPRTSWDLSLDLDDSQGESIGNIPDLPLSNPLPPADDISKTYVCLSSPASSPLSSIRGSQPDVTSRAVSEAEGHNSARPGTAWDDVSPTNAATLPTSTQPANVYTRSLRERAPIQLHPYAMEQEKYRQTLKARGIAPMRLAHTQDEDDRRIHIPSSDPVSQDLESQDVERETEESQPIDFDFDWDLDPVSTEKNIESQVQGNRRSDDSASNDDDEFPDVNDLLRGQQPRRKMPKQRINTYSSKSRRPDLFRTRTHSSTRISNYAAEELDVFDVPASPPATSSPNINSVRNTGTARRQALLISSKEPTPSLMDRDELNPFQDLPTPVTSATKPVSNPMQLDSDTREDPFTSEATISASSSSSDESIQIRKVSKKIRGVLPASHLRLDQQLKKLRHSIQTQRDSVSTSPERSLLRRGVALPIVPGITQSGPSSTNAMLSFLSDSSDDEESSHEEPAKENGNDAIRRSLFEQSRLGFAEEEDRIDAMLPPLKRQGKFKKISRKKMRIGSGSMPNTYQPKITEHLVEEHSTKRQRRRAQNGNTSRKKRTNPPVRDITPKPPRLSILDLVSSRNRRDTKVPTFIKLAARVARSKKGHGRQSPSRKFIRLASREDTFDAQSMLEEWKGGRILPKVLVAPDVGSSIGSRPPLGHIADNCQTLLKPPIANRTQALEVESDGLNKLRQLVISKGKQISIKNYALVQQPMLPPTYSKPDFGSRAVSHLFQRRTTKSRPGAQQSRPAQLEDSEIANSDRFLTAAFRRTKKDLDARFKLGQKQAIQQQNVPLHRFLADEDLVRPSIEIGEAIAPGPLRSALPEMINRSNPKKRVPTRIDTSAARFRQPTDPLVLDLLTPGSVEEVPGQVNKLRGLGKYGVRYPIHFDVSPLPPGTFFHESTFIGSGRLSEAIKVPTVIPLGLSRGFSSFRLGEKDFRWGLWDEDVSSEVGVLFDCLVELLTQASSSYGSPEPVPVTLVDFLIAYAQHSVSFRSSDALSSFLARMLEALQDFISRVKDAQPRDEERDAHRWIISLTRCAVLILQLLQISRAVQDINVYKLEHLLQSVGCLCMKLMVDRGLDKLRKLYDDLQYLSFRERGIRDDHYIAHSWVIILRVLNVARIPKASFWDLTNKALTEGNSNPTTDARVMEQTWYSAYSLLPLFEIDEFGVLIPGFRRRATFDNWALPQLMLRSVFTLYSSGATQSPSFNDYCRALLSRCHYLMREWDWWKCSGLIGTLFDFFASRKFEHLRNEEVYKSPRFLTQLDTEPSLEVEPEDRCFHIFLKIVALAIRHFRKVGDERSIRNLVARLLPNHDRQYPKDEEVHERDLAALRNHHDLLCTLYWASPPDCRPSLFLIQGLVDADNSHREACLINLRALDNLARYTFVSSVDESAVYKLLTNWELTTFDKILQQCLDAGPEARKLAEFLAASNAQPVTEREIQMTIEESRECSLNTIQTLLSNLRRRISRCKDAEATMSALNAELLSKLLDPCLFELIGNVKQGLIGDTIDVLHSYLDRTNVLHPLGPRQSITSPERVDSQESLDFADLNIERQMMIYPLHEIILPNFCLIMRGILECQLYESIDPPFTEALVMCWARLVSCITEEKHDLTSFVVDGPNAVFENRQRHARANKYWPLFLGQLLADKSVDDLKVCGFDLSLEWMQIITSCPRLLSYEPELSKQMYQKGHYLCNADEAPLHQEWPKRHLRMFQVALNTMRMIKIDPNHGGFAERNNLSEKDTQSLFSNTLKSTMDSMQRQLESMILQSFPHIEYVKFCQDAISHIRGYASTIRPVTDFFLRHSVHYWPKSDDPLLYAAGIVSYSLRLHSQRRKAPVELFHYLYSGWKNDQMQLRPKSHIACVLKGLKIWAFAEFMLADFVPAIILAGFNTVGGCVLAKTYLPALAKRSQQFLLGHGSESSGTFTHLVNILKMIINCTRILIVHRLPYQGFGDDHSLSLSHRGILSVVFHFWISIQPALNEYVDVHPKEEPLLGTITGLLNDLISDVAFHLAIHNDCGSSTGRLLDVTTGEYVERFVAALQDDMQKHWVVSMAGSVEVGGDSVMLKIATGAREGGSFNVPLFQGVPAFNEVLELWKLASGGTTHERQLRKTERGLGFPDWMTVDHIDRFPGVFRGLF